MRRKGSDQQKRKLKDAAVATKESAWRVREALERGNGTNMFSFSHVKAGFPFKQTQMNYWADIMSTRTTAARKVSQGNPLRKSRILFHTCL